MARSIPISKTKIVIPHRRTELLSRPRLLESFSASLERKLILLSAPAGYGKTSLLVDFAHTTDLPVCWLSLDPLDRDPQRFMAYIVAALVERFPGLAAPLEPLLNGLKSIETDAEPLLVALTNELYEQVEVDFLFIIDDYHLLDDVPIISGLFNRFVQLVDENCHIILSSRFPPALPDLTLLIAREQVDGLNQAELAFQPREIQAYFSQNQHQHVSDQEAAELVEQTAGWITGIILSNQTGAAGIADSDAYAYLSRQVLDQQPEPLREFLMRTSLPEEFSAELCEAMLKAFYPDGHNWTKLMEQVLKRNLFVLPLGKAHERWLRYHPLFREFLQQRLKEERPQEVQRILKGLTHAYQQKGDWEKAYYTCQQLEDPEALAAVIEASGRPMLQRAFTTLEFWLNSLPPTLIRNRPRLISLRGAVAIMKNNPQDAIDLLNPTIAIFRRRKDISGLALALVRRAFAYRDLGNYAASLQDADEALTLTEPRVDLQSLYAEALRMKGVGLHRLGQAKQAIEYLEHSLALYTALDESGSITRLLEETGVVYHAVGEIESAKTFYYRALKTWRSEKNFRAQASVLNNLAFLFHQTGEYELALETFEEAYLCARKSSFRQIEAFILLSLGDLYAEVGEYESATLAYQKVEPIAQDFPGSFISTYLVLASANLAVLQGDFVKARQIIKPVRNNIEVSPSFYERGLYKLLVGRICLLESKAEKAIIALESCKACFTSDGRETEALWSRVWLAAALYQGGKLDAAREEVRETLGSGTKFTHPLLAVLRQARPWITGLQRDLRVGPNLSGALEKVKDLEARLPAVRRALRRSAQAVQVSAPGLIIQAFGRAEVRVAGRVIPMSEWRTQPARDLLFYFLLKRQPVTKEQIVAAFWPEDNDPQTIRQRFKTYISRLRRATRRDIILFDEEHYQFNHALDYEYDVEAFQSYLARARAVRETMERIEYNQKAVDLVRGPYLAGVEMPWALGERERLAELYLAALEELANLYLSVNRIEEAISTSRKALASDPYREGAYRSLMRAHAARGERNAVIQQYRVCKDLLGELDLLPSPETDTLYRDLTL